MAQKLPDETLRDILASVLDVPDDDFANVLSTSPFALRQSSTSEILLVCKRWMRVATPLLYDTVVLRSMAQAQALAKALKKHPEFGPFLRKLRVEGGFGASVGKAMSLATGITDLLVTVSLQAKDNVKSMCDAMRELPNLRRLVLNSSGESHNGQVRALLDAIKYCLSTRASLTKLEIPDHCLMTDWLVPLLTNATRISCVHVRGTIGCYGWSDNLAAILKVDTVCAVRLDVSALPQDLSPSRTGNIAALFSNKLIFAAAAAPEMSVERKTCFYHTSVPARLGFTPFSQVPESLRSALWKMILAHAIPRRRSCCFTVFRSISEEDQEHKVPYNATRYSLVCKLFNTLCTEILARTVQLHNSQQCAEFTQFLERHHGLQADVRTLHIPASLISGQNALADLLPRLTNLRLASAYFVHPDCLLELLTHSAQSLVDLVLSVSGGDKETALRGTIRLPALRRLQFQSSANEWCGEKSQAKFDLPVLNELDLRITNAAVLKIFTLSSMPVLRCLTLECADDVDAAGFLRANGSHCQDLKIRNAANTGRLIALCPRLEVLHLAYIELLDARALASSTLSTLYMPRFSAFRRGAAARAEEALWEAFVRAITTERCPALQEVIVPSLHWPTSPRDIEKSLFVAWAEWLHEKGIKLADREGQGWRPRLKANAKGI